VAGCQGSPLLVPSQGTAASGYNSGMKYSLRSLMIVVTLIAVVLGVVMGRVEYLGRWATFHERKSDELREETFSELYTLSDLHDWKAEEYRKAMWRPWSLVNELPTSSAPAPNPPQISP
jgi:hypothetical protein